MKVFMSYTWEDKEHIDWVEALAARLRRDGIETILDQWEVGLGDELPKFMEEGIRDHDRILVICTPEYKRKADGRIGGAGYETRQITAEVLNNPEHGKFIPVLRKGAWKDSAPTYLLGINYVDLSYEDTEQYERQYCILLDDLLGKRKKAPKVGVPTTKTKFDDFKLSFLQDKLMGRAWRVGPDDIRYEDGLLMDRERLKYIIDSIMDYADFTGTTHWIPFFTLEEFEHAIQSKTWKNGKTVYSYSELEIWEVIKRSAGGLYLRLKRVLGEEHLQYKVMDDGSICFRYIK